MAALLFYLCVALELTFLVAGQSVHYVLKGREAILTPSLSKAPDDILWKHNGDRVISFDSAEERVFRPYEGRVTLGWGNAELTIADVRYEDSGEYELEAHYRDRKMHSQYMLKVLDKVSKPVIRCELSDYSGNSTAVRRATLLCSSDSNTPEALTFKWNLEGKSHPGQALTIALGDEHDHIEYSCTATNPLHAESSVFQAKDCHTERSSPALDVIVPIVIASLILLAFCIFPFIFRHQIKRACFRSRKTTDLEKQITEPDSKNKDEDRPLLLGDIHRQETFPSKQRLLVQSDFEKEIPEQNDVGKEEELKASRKVKKRSKKFRNHTESQPDTATDNDTDVGEAAAALPSAPIRNEEVDSERETDLSQREFYVAPKPEEDEAEALSRSLSSDLEEGRPGRGGHDGGRQRDSDGDPDVSHSDPEEAPQTVEAGDSSSARSGPEEALTQAVESQTNLGSSVTKEESSPMTNEDLPESSVYFIAESIVNHEPQTDFTDEELDSSRPDPAAGLSQQPDSLPRAPEVDVDSEPEPHEADSTEPSDSDEKLTPIPEFEDPLNDSVVSEPEEAGESEESNDPQTSPLLTELQGSQPESAPQSSPAPVQDSKSEPEPEPEDEDEVSPEKNLEQEDPQRDSDSDSETSDQKHKEADDADLQTPSADFDPAADSSSSQTELDENCESVEEAKGPEHSNSSDEEPQKQESSNEESEETTQTRVAELTPTDDSEPPADSPPSQSALSPDSDSAPTVEEVKGPEESNSGDEEPQKRDSSSEESVESTQTRATEITATDETEPSGSQPQSPLQSSVSPDLDSKPETEPEEESRPEADPDPEDSRRDSDHESDTSDGKDDKPGDAALTDVQPPSPDTEPTADGSNPDSAAEAKGPEESNSSDEEPQKRDSSNEESEESTQSRAAETTAAEDSELPGSEKESTHPPASALSQASQKEQSKDAEAEDASSAQVSEETKDNTDKDSDSSSSEQINQAAAESKAGQQQQG